MYISFYRKKMSQMAKFALVSILIFTASDYYILIFF